MAASSSGSNPTLVPLRRWPHPGRRSASSGRASVRMKMGWDADQSRRLSRKSSRPGSAHWRSSITMTTGSRSASRSKSIRQPAKRSSRARSPSAAPSSWASRGSMKARSASFSIQLVDAGFELGPHHLRRVLLADAEAAGGPSGRAPSRRRRRRRRGTGPGARGRSKARPSTYLSNSQASRDLPTPAGPTIETQPRRAATFSGAVELVLHEPQLVVATDELGLEHVAPVGTRGRRRSPARPARRARGRPCP